MKTIEIMGVQVDAVTAPEALVGLREGLQAGKRLQVVTVNNEMIMRAQKEPAFKRVINAADLRVADAAGVVWAAKYLQQPLQGPFKGIRAHTQAFTNLVWLLVWPRRVKTEIKETVPGSDLAVDLAGMCEEFGYRLFLLGGEEGIAEQAGRKLRDMFPGLQVSGAMPGSPDRSKDTQVLRRIRTAGAQVLLVAYGAGKQERWIARNLSKLPKPMVAVGVGGTLDYLAHGVPGAGGRRPPPGIVRQRGLEWLWRLLTQPARWRRIVTALPVFVTRVIRHKRTR